MSEDREWTLNNVEEVRVNTKDIDEICFGLEQLTIFATETIQNFATDILKLHQENQQLKEDLKYVLEQTLGAFTQNWCIDWNFTDIRDKYSISDTYEWNSGKNE